jgi:Y_Y_Y domain
MASFSLPPDHPFANVRPGYAGFESTPPGSIINVTTSYIGAVGDYTNNSITLNLYSTTGGTWNVTTPAGLTRIKDPTSDPQTTIVYNRGTKGNTYTFNSITITNLQGTTISWSGTPPSVTLFVPTQNTTIISGYYDQSYIYITPLSNVNLGTLIPGITDYYVKCSNNSSYIPVDTTTTALFPYPSGTTFSPSSTTTLNFTVACRSNGILGQESSSFPINIVQPAIPSVTITSTPQNVNLNWTQRTANTIASISYGGNIISSNTPSPFSFSVSTPGNYSFQVISTLCGLSTYSSIVTTQVLPAQPTGVIATSSGLTVSLSWIGLGSGYSYNVSGTGTTVTQNVTTTSAIFTNVGVGSQRFYVQSVYNSLLSSLCNVPVDVTTTTPYNLTTSVVGSTVTLNWSSGTPGATFNVSSSSDNQSHNTSVSNYSWSGLTAATYTFFVTSISRSITSGTASATGTVSLLAPQNFNVTTSGSTANLNWTEDSVGATFDVCYGTSAPYSSTATFASGTTTGAIYNLAIGSYTFYIRSSLPAGTKSSYANTTGSVISTPTDFKGYSIGSTISLSWSQSTTGCSFLITSGTGGITCNTTSSNLNIRNNAVGLYNFSLIASNTSSFKSSKVNLPNTIYVLDTPSPTATYSSGNVTVTWNLITNANSYTITSSPTGLTDPAPSSSRTATYTNVPPGTYTFSVVATDANGDTSSAGTSSVSVSVPTPTNFSGIMSTSSTVHFTWNESNTNVTSFTISAIPSGTTITYTNVSNYADLTNVPNSANYSFTVSAGYGTLTSPASSPSINVYGFPTLSNAITASCSFVNGVYAATVSNVISTDQWSHYPNGNALNSTVGSSSTVVAKYSGSAIPPPLTSGTAGDYYSEFYSQKTYISNTISSSFPFYVKPPVITSVTASGGSITVNWTDSTTGGSVYSVRSSDGTLSSNGIAANTGTVTFNNATIGTNYIFTVSAGYSSSSNFTRKFIRSSDGSNVTQDAISIPYTVYAPSLTSNVTAIAAPTGVTATATGTSITVNWNAVTNATTYYVYKSTGSTNVGNVTTYTYTGTVGTQENIQVQSISNTTASNISSVVPVTPIANPVINSITQAGGSFINVRCQTPTSGTLSINTPTGLTLINNNPIFNFTGFSSNTQYSFTVTCTATNATSSVTSNFSTINTPTNVTATPNGTSTVTVNWTYPSSSLVAGASYGIVVNGFLNSFVNHPTTTYTYNQTPGTTTYSNYIIAFDSTRASFGSSTVVVTDLTTSASVFTPTLSGKKIIISFSYPTGSTTVTTFKIYDSLNNLYATINYVSTISQYSYTTNELTPGNSYSFYVRTTDTYGNTIDSSTTSSKTIPNPPTINSILQNGTNITVTCASPPSGTTLSCSTPTGLTSVSSSSPTFVFSGAVQNTTYNFTVTATGNSSSTSTTQSFTTLYTPVLQSISANGNNITVSWTYSGTSIYTTFKLYNSDGSLLATVTGATTKTFTGTAGTTYIITITATDTNGNVSLPSIPPGPPLTSPPLDYCVLWLDASDVNGNGSIPYSGRPIDFWRDKSYYGNHAYVSDPQDNGYPSYTNKAINFGNGSGYNLGNPSLLPSINGTFFFVVTSYNPYGNDMIFAYGPDGPVYGNKDLVQFSFEGAHLSLEFLNNPDQKINSIYDGYNRVCITGSFYNNGNFYISRNGVQFGSFDDVYINPQIANIGYYYNSRAYSFQYFSGDINEIIIYNTLLGDNLIQRIESYLKTKWSIN